MKPSLIKMNFFETYYYANVINNVLNNAMAYSRSLHEWHEDQAVELLLQPFQKWSVLHSFSYFIIEDIIYENIEKSDSNEALWVEHAFHHHRLDVESFKEWLIRTGSDRNDINAIGDYHSELRMTGWLELLIENMVNEVFLILFSNRQLLQNLNEYVAGIVSFIEISELDENQVNYLNKDGVPKRAKIPEWVKRAVFFRDRGRCVSCSLDISNLVSLQSSKHFDHMVPLARGGINDVTNIQLMCEKCNLMKGKKDFKTSKMYEPWYV
jgi:hypothetical protein